MNCGTVSNPSVHGTRKTCSSGKRVYESAEQAMQDAERLVTVKSFRGTRARCYRCPLCKQFHISTKHRSGRTQWATK